MTQLNASHLSPAHIQTLNLPERVLMFGTGVLLRGLHADVIHQANLEGRYDGRILMAKSTQSGSLEAFHKQGYLYTLVTRGQAAGQVVDQAQINSSLSRVLDANTHWQAILESAQQPEFQVVISNTTDVGITYLAEDIMVGIPSTYPGKLTAWLYARWQAGQAGVVVLPAELLEDNATRLQQFVLQHAEANACEAAFSTWIKDACRWYNGMIDRIVPGKPDTDAMASLEQQLGYTDELMVSAEPYLFWAIEAPDSLAETVGFLNDPAGRIFISTDISQVRERKIRLLNGLHSLTCGLAIGKGFKTVGETVNDLAIRSFMEATASEICAVLPFEQKMLTSYMASVFDRFANPFIAHEWQSIALEYTGKIASRTVPTLHYAAAKPEASVTNIARGWAGWLHFMWAAAKAGQILKDSKADKVLAHFQQDITMDTVIHRLLADSSLWGTDLSQHQPFIHALQAAWQQDWA